MIKRMLIFLSLGFVCSCHVNSNREVRNNDSVEVLLSVLKSKSFLKGNLAYSDSLYFIKSKFYKKDFPTSSEYFMLFYIDNTPENKRLNFPEKGNDKRERYEITKFSLFKDKANIALYNHGVRESYEFNLGKTGETWHILKENLVIY